MDPLETWGQEDASLAFDLLNADDPTWTSRRRPKSKSLDSDTLSADQSTPAPVRQPLLRAIHHELSLLAAEADGVSEKVKVGLLFCFVLFCFSIECDG